MDYPQLLSTRINWSDREICQDARHVLGLQPLQPSLVAPSATLEGDELFSSSVLPSKLTAKQGVTWDSHQPSKHLE